MSVTVVDASAIAAVVFDEPEAAPLIASVTGALIAPGLLRYGLLARLAVDYAEPDWESLPLLARQWEISAYDAAYLQLALGRKAPLVTLDSRLAKAYDRAAANA